MATIVRANAGGMELRGLARAIVAWLPLVVLPVAAGVLTWDAAAWVHMWALAVSIYAGFKWATLATSARAAGATPGRVAGYLLLWTGMDADAFFGGPTTSRPRWSQWAWAVGQSTV